MQYTPSTLNAVQFTQHTLAINACISHNMCLYEMCAYRQKNNFADSSKVRVKNIMISSSCRWWRFLTATCAIACLIPLVCRNSFMPPLKPPQVYVHIKATELGRNSTILSKLLSSQLKKKINQRIRLSIQAVLVKGLQPRGYSISEYFCLFVWFLKE